MLPSEVQAIGASDYDLLLRYWRAEPWGSYRDNMHAALIANEVRRPYRKNPLEGSFEDFMLQDRSKLEASKTNKFLAFLRAMAKPKAQK